MERIADQVPVWNNFVAYVPFSNEKHLRYLYSTYPSVRGKTLFRAKDRLLLTKSIIDKYFDCEVLADRSRGSFPVITDILALHDANRGELLTVEILQRHWVTFWRPSAKEAGAPYVSHPAYDPDEELSWYLRPISLPLSEIRDYFGEKIGLHYAWYGFYIFYLIFPAILGIAMEVIIQLRGYIDTNGHLDIPTFVVLLSIILWGSMYHSSWEVEENIISLKWGTHDLQTDDNTDRPQFRPDPEQPTKRSNVNNRLVTNFPQSKRTARTFLTMTAVIFAVFLDLAAIGFFFYVDVKIFHVKSLTFTWVSAFLQAIVIKIATYLFKPWAKILTDYENHRGEMEFEDNLVSKIVLFETVNSFAALLYTAFLKDSISGCYNDSCIGDLRYLLIAIIIVRVSVNILELLYPTIRRLVLDLVTDKAAVKSKETDNLLAQTSDDVDENTDYMAEIDRGYYDGAFDDYSYSVFQYGYLMLFVSALPFLGFITLFRKCVENANRWFETLLLRSPSSCTIV